jgi:plasmid stability protein
MPDLTITGIPQEELEALAARGARHGRSIEEEARHLLHDAAAEQLLVSELEQAAQAAAARFDAVPPARAATARGGNRRRYSYEPTPRRK